MTDPMPFKLRVLHAVTDAMKTITPDNGYHTDLSDFEEFDNDVVPPTSLGMTSRVYRGRAWFGDSDPIPMLSILEGVTASELVEDTPLPTVAGEYDWPLLIQGFVDDDKLNPTDPAYYFLADVRKRFAVEQVRKRGAGSNLADPFGLGSQQNRIVTLRIGSGVVRPADDVSAKAYFWLQVSMRIFEHANDPYL